jgi:hypothetical protein
MDAGVFFAVMEDGKSRSREWCCSAAINKSKGTGFLLTVMVICVVPEDERMAFPPLPCAGEGWGRGSLVRFTQVFPSPAHGASAVRDLSRKQER